MAHDRIQPRAPQALAAPAIVHEALARPGAPLPEALLALGRARLGFDVSRVRVHTDAPAAASADALFADAYTVGHHIAFAAGRFQPDTRPGQQLLMHELTHVAEQRGGPAPPPGELIIETSRESLAERGESGGLIAPPPRISVCLQRRTRAGRDDGLAGLRADVRAVADLQRQTREEAGGIADDIRVALAGHDQQRLLTALKKARGDPLKGALLVHDPGLPEAILRWPQYTDRAVRAVAYALLSTDDLEQGHVQIAVHFARGTWNEIWRILGADRSHQRLFEIEQRFNHDLGALFVPHSTLIRCLRTISRRPSGPLRFVTQSQLVVASQVPFLHTIMALDHEPHVTEMLGLSLLGRAPDGHRPLLAALRQASARGRTSAPLAAWVATWAQHVQQLAGWRRDELRLAESWCGQGPEGAMEEVAPRDAWLEVRAYFDGLRAAQQDAADQREADELRAPTGDANAAATRRAAAERTEKLRALAQTLHQSIRVDRHAALLWSRLRPLRIAEITDLAGEYRGLYGAELRRDARRFRAHDNDFFSVLGLLTTGRPYDPYVELAAALSAEDVQHAHAVLYPLKNPQRRQLEQDYTAAFAGLVPFDEQRTPYAHVAWYFGRNGPDWWIQKTSLLLEHAITPAEELYFRTRGTAEDAAILKILQDEWNAGYERIGRLDADWNAYIRLARLWSDGTPLSTLTLREAVTEALDGEEARQAEVIFKNYAYALKAREVGLSNADPALYAAADAIKAAVKGIGTAKTEVEKQVALFGSLLRAARAADKNNSQRARLDYIESEVRTVLSDTGYLGEFKHEESRRYLLILARGGAASDADEIYRWTQIRERVSGNEIGARMILDIVTRVWAAGTLGALRADAETPIVDRKTGAILRPIFDLDRLTPSAALFGGQEAHLYDRVRHMLQAGERAEIAAIRLEIELQAPYISRPERVAGALAFLGMVRPQEVRAALVAYARRYLRSLADTTPADAFLDHVIDTFGLVKEVADLEDAARGATADTRERVARGRLREAGLHTGRASAVARFLGTIYSGRDLGPPIAQALRNLEQIARDEVVQPKLLAEGASRAGVASGAELAAQQDERFRSFVRDDHALRQDAADFLGLVVEIGGRSLLVAVLGPAGIGGLAAALISISAGYALRHELVGANYETFSPKNLGNLATEVTGAFGPVVEKLAEGVAKVAFSSALAQKIVGAALGKLAGETIDGAVERALLQNGGPSFDRFVGKAISAATEGLVKGLGEPLFASLTAFRKYKERAPLQVMKVLTQGPPPKASWIRTPINETLKAAEDAGKRDAEIDTNATLKNIGKGLLIAVPTAISAGLSLAYVKQVEAREVLDALRKDPATLGRLITSDPVLGAHYRSFADAQAARGRAVEEPGLWALRVAEDRARGRLEPGALSVAPEVHSLRREFGLPRLEDNPERRVNNAIKALGEQTTLDPKSPEYAKALKAIHR